MNEMIKETRLHYKIHINNLMIFRLIVMQAMVILSLIPPYQLESVMFLD